MGFTPCKAKQSFQVLELQKKKKKIKACKKAVQKELNDERCLLKLAFRKGQKKKFYSERIPESSSLRKEMVDINILITCRNDDRKIMHPIKGMSGPPTRIREWNQFSQFR